MCFRIIVCVRCVGLNVALLIENAVVTGWAGKSGVYWTCSHRCRK